MRMSTEKILFDSLEKKKKMNARDVEPIFNMENECERENVRSTEQ